jgi:hypothetical protein
VAHAIDAATTSRTVAGGDPQSSNSTTPGTGRAQKRRGSGS